MAEVETNVMLILLKSLLKQGLVTADTYNGAVERVHKMEANPEFFEYRRRCRRGEQNGYTRNQRRNEKGKVDL